MTDLPHVLPDFSTRPFSHLLPSLDRHRVTSSDILSLDAVDVAKRAQVPVAEVRKLAAAILSALHRQLRVDETAPPPQVQGEWRTISTLDRRLDRELGGGIPTRYLTEITGESGAGKTQFLLTLLLSAQLPAPHGLSRSALYISTEAALATMRLTQLLESHPQLSTLPPNSRPSLQRILAIQTPDLESQDHILRYQLPVAIKKYDVGLIVLDSVAANFRAEFERPENGTGGAAMAKRSSQLVQLGALLRHLARTNNLAVVVANQVADRFTPPPPAAPSASASRTTSYNSQGGEPLISPEPMTMDHQQRWFTGWGDTAAFSQNMKTPSLGLVWTNQIAARIALLKQPVFASEWVSSAADGREDWRGDGSEMKRWRRWFKVVFAPWVKPSEGKGVEFTILGSGLAAETEES